ncbi:MAG: hypothetical protein U1E70_05395 [Acetobacteraceae bacterium]|nr:hypothetical protein [Pseudomonadota bacterium]
MTGLITCLVKWVAALVPADKIGTTINLTRQSHEFSSNKTAQLVGLTGFIFTILGMDPTIAEGTVLTENVYWDMNEHTHGWKQRGPAAAIPGQGA